MAILVAYQGKAAAQHGMEGVAFEKLAELINLAQPMLQQAATVAL